MKTEFLADWDVLALQRLAEFALENRDPRFETDSLAALVTKLQDASHIRLSYRKSDAA